jgi:hypothetical protein
MQGVGVDLSLNIEITARNWKSDMLLDLEIRPDFELGVSSIHLIEEIVMFGVHGVLSSRTSKYVGKKDDTRVLTQGMYEVLHRCLP